MKLKIIGPVLLLLISFSTSPLNVHAVSYVPAHYHRGEIIYMFQSGTVDVKRAIHLNDVLIVYRETSKSKIKEVGRVKALSYMRDIYLKAEVMEGFIHPDDIAKKDGASCLVIHGSPFEKDY